MRHDHVCAVFDDRTEFVAGAVAFLAEGLSLGMRVGYVTDRDTDWMLAELASLGDVDALIRSGQLLVASVHDTYVDGQPVEPANQVAFYKSATSAAVADGFRGLRVAADATPLVRTPQQLCQFLRYEHLVDHLMIGEPFSAMCGYDTSTLDTSTVEQLACLHPHSTGREPQFHVAASGDGAALLDGETDGTTCDLLAGLCDIIWPPDGLVLDLASTEFIDHRSLLALDATAVRHEQRLRLRNPSSTVTKLAGLLDLRATELVSR